MLRKKSPGNIVKPVNIDPDDPSQYRQHRLSAIRSLPKQLQNQLEWLYEYPIIEGRVTNPAVEEFLNGVIYLPGAKGTDAYCDLNERGTTVNFNSVTCGEENLVQFLEKFLAGSEAYTENEKSAVAKFIASRGGQDLNFLTQLLVKYNHFLPPDLNGQASLHQEDHIQNWTIGSNGKATFNWESDFLSLTTNCERHHELCSIVKDAQSKINHYSMTNQEGRLGIDDLNKTNKTPLLRVKYEIQLDMIDGKVIPIITNLSILNFTDGLLKPEERLVNKQDDKANQIFACMQHIDKVITEKGYDYKSPEYRALEVVRRILKQSDGGKDIEAVQFSMKYIESLTLAVCEQRGFNLFGKNREKSLADIWKGDSKFASWYSIATATKTYRPLSRPQDIKPLINYLLRMGEGMNPVIADGDFKFQIGAIYLNLCKFFKNYAPYSSLSCIREGASVEGVFVEEWRQRVAKAQRSYRDSKGEQSIDESVKTFLDIKGAYNEEQLSVVRTWMKTKPMESVSSLLSYMFSNHLFEIADAPHNTICGLSQSRISESHWHFDRDGRIKLSLTYDIDAIVALNELNNSSVRLVRHLQKDSLIISNDKAVAPIARVNTEITLDVNSALEVIPNVTYLDIVSYTKDFKISNDALLRYSAGNDDLSKDHNIDGRLGVSL